MKKVNFTSQPNPIMPPTLDLKTKTSTHFLHFPPFPQGNRWAAPQIIASQELGLRDASRLPFQKPEKGSAAATAATPPLTVSHCHNRKSTRAKVC